MINFALGGMSDTSILFFKALKRTKKRLMNIKHTVAIKDLHAHIFKVILTLNNPNLLGQIFSLPNCSYLIRDFC